MIYDIGTKEAAFKFIKNFLNLEWYEFINEYEIECKNNIDTFLGKREVDFDALNVEDLKYMGFHVTTNWDDSEEIKKYGLRDLQIVLTENTNLKKFLQDYGISFDIKSKILLFNGEKIDIDYEKYIKKGALVRNEKEESIKNVGKKIYNDYQVNAFFSIDDMLSYGSEIEKYPEFLHTLSGLIPIVNDAKDLWTKKSKRRVISFTADFNQLLKLQYYANENECNDDINNIVLKKLLIKNAIKRSVGNSVGTYLFLKKGVTITPEQITDYDYRNIK